MMYGIKSIEISDKYITQVQHFYMKLELVIVLLGAHIGI